MSVILITNVPDNLNAAYEAFTLIYKRPAVTSRGVLNEKQLWIISLTDSAGKVAGKGECSIIPGLSPDFISTTQYETKLEEVCGNPSFFLQNLHLLAKFPSIQFGLETAFLDWQKGGNQLLFDNSFTRKETSIPINGLVWMGDETYMQEQIEAKIAQGFNCIKMKVGAIDFDTELKLLRSIRNRYSEKEIILRVDANGAFTPGNALKKLEQLSELRLHSIEQPIMAGQPEEMSELCRKTPLPIALDEELIGITEAEEKRKLLEQINPQFIILKPSLHGGLTGTQEWIEIADILQIPYWLTSALESNIGLNAIAQFSANFNVSIPQGLGTGGLYTSNFPPTTEIRNGRLYFSK